MIKPKKIPSRMCVGCQEMKPKKELLRIVKTNEGVIDFDSTGKKNGRGAYICPRPECLQAAKKKKRLENAFECNISEEVYNELFEIINKTK